MIIADRARINGTCIPGLALHIMELRPPDWCVLYAMPSCLILEHFRPTHSTGASSVECPHCFTNVLDLIIMHYLKHTLHFLQSPNPSTVSWHPTFLVYSEVKQGSIELFFGAWKWNKSCWKIILGGGVPKVSLGYVCATACFRLICGTYFYLSITSISRQVQTRNMLSMQVCTTCFHNMDFGSVHRHV